MEAATSAPAAAEAEGQVQEGQQQEAQSPEVGIQEWQQGIDTRLGESLDSIRELAEVVQTRLPEPAAEPEPDFDAQFQELFEQNGGFPDPAQFQQLARQQAESIAKEMIAPLQQQFDGIQQKMTEEKLGALQTKFPELGDPTKGRDGMTNADRLADEAVTRAVRWGAPQFANNDEFVEMVHRDMQSRQRAQQETPAGQGSIPQIETGGGAAPASSGGDEWDKIVQAGRKPVW